MHDQKLTHLKVKIKTLAAEGSIIRKEEDKALEREGGGCGSAYESLYQHRTQLVRPVARQNLLAYGFLRGRTYISMEAKTQLGAKQTPDFKEIEKIARRFCTTWDDARWAEWVTAAEAHIASLRNDEKAKKAAA